jgi:hypothetical protein
MMHVVAVVLVLLSGCISKDECNLEGKKAEGDLINAAPGAVIAKSLAGCSTCGHSKVKAHWSNLTIDPSTTGYVEIQLAPHCLSRDTTVMADVQTSNGEGVADNNYMNCGDVVDYDGYVTNRTNVTLQFMDMEMICPTTGE